jgi:hypothetical protein
MAKLYCHVYGRIKTGFGLVIGFIDHLLVVSTINYNTVTDVHATKHSTLISSVYLHYPSRNYNTVAIKVSLNHTLPILLYYSTYNIFKSHVKFSQADFLYPCILFELTACLLVRVLLLLLLLVTALYALGLSLT